MLLEILLGLGHRLCALLPLLWILKVEVLLELAIDLGLSNDKEVILPVIVIMSGTTISVKVVSGMIVVLLR